MTRTIYRLDDAVVMQLLRLMQIGLLTGTDVVDHFRMLALEPSANDAEKLVLTPEYMEHDAVVIDKLFDDLEKKLLEDKRLNETN
jgi:hypothetical protein